MPRINGEKLREFREQQFLTQSDFKCAGVSTRTIRRAEAGGSVSYKKILLIAQKLGVDPELLLGGDPEHTEPTQVDIVIQLEASAMYALERNANKWCRTPEQQAKWLVMCGIGVRGKDNE